MNDVLKDDPRNEGIEVSAHYENYVDTSVLVLDLQSISGSNSRADVFRVFLQFAEKMKSEQFSTVEMAYKGETKFMIEGDYFQKLGGEYGAQNPVYTVRTFPENLMNPDGSRAYPEWTGGLLVVAAKQIQDFNDFHDKWYLNDVINKTQGD